MTFVITSSSRHSCSRVPILRAAIFCCFLAHTSSVFSTTSSSGTVFSQVQPPKASQSSEPVSAKERGTADLPLFVRSVPSIESEADVAHKAYEHHEKPTLDRWLTWSTVALAFFTLVLAIFTGLMWVATYRLAVHAKETATQQDTDTKNALKIARDAADASKVSADAARDNAIAALGSNRAFVYATPYWTDTEDGGAFFGVNWTNGGNTPTKNLRTRIDYVIWDGELLKDFSFPDNVDPIGTGFLAPKQMFAGPRIPQNQPLASVDVDQILNGSKRLYFFGWAKYFDMFPGTPERTTTFCFFVQGNRGSYGFPIHVAHNDAT